MKRLFSLLLTIVMILSLVPTISADEFTGLLLTYAYAHRDTDGSPWIDENMDPETGIWLAREILRQKNRPDKERGRHYNHSTFIDLVMTGICGICADKGDTLVIHPLGTSLESFEVRNVCYHGHMVDVTWDRSAGLCVVVDSTREFFADAVPDVRLQIAL